MVSDGFFLLTTGVGEVDDVAVLLEHVDLLDSLDGLDVKLLQGGLELLVVGTGAGGRPLDLPAGGTLATIQTLLDHAIALYLYMTRLDIRIGGSYFNRKVSVGDGGESRTLRQLVSNEMTIGDGCGGFIWEISYRSWRWRRAS